MNGWQEPKDGKRIYLITDNTRMDGFTDYIKEEDIERLYVTYSESRVNLGIHYYRNSLYSSNLVGISRVKSVDAETLYDAEGNELLIKVVPRFNVTVVELLNYIRFILLHIQTQGWLEVQKILESTYMKMNRIRF